MKDRLVDRRRQGGTRVQRGNGRSGAVAERGEACFPADTRVELGRPEGGAVDAMQYCVRVKIGELRVRDRGRGAWGYPRSANSRLAQLAGGLQDAVLVTERVFGRFPV